MANIVTEGLVLRSYNLSDADKIVIFLTEKNGLVKGVAKGAKRLKSKFGGAIEPYSIVNLSYYQKDERELVSLQQIEIEKSFLKNTSNIEFLSKFDYLSQLLIEFTPPNDPNNRLYNMSKICLETASVNSNNLESIILYFEIWLLKLGGFLPSWESCHQCKRRLNDTESSTIRFDFHLICVNCQILHRDRTIPEIQRKFYNFAQKTSPQKFADFTREYIEDQRRVSQILRRIISHILGKESVGEKILMASNNQ